MMYLSFMCLTFHYGKESFLKMVLCPSGEENDFLDLKTGFESYCAGKKKASGRILPLVLKSTCFFLCKTRFLKSKSFQYE